MPVSPFIESLTSLEVAQSIREEIKKKTNCPASAGIASNILLARMCTRVAKPNGQFHLKDDDTAEFIGAFLDFLFFFCCINVYQL